MHFLIVLLSLAVLGQACSRAEPLPSAAALSLADSLGAQAQFRNFLKLVALRTTTLRGAASKSGAAVVTTILDEEIERTAPLYEPDWQRNMARAYAELLTEAEMQSLVADRQRSPHNEKLNRVMPIAGERMKQLSEPLLRTAAEMVVTNTFMRVSQLPGSGRR
jgi:hypothetical protein